MYGMFTYIWLIFMGIFVQKNMFWTTILLDLRKVNGKTSPNGGLMVIYYGRKQKITLNKQKSCLKWW